MKLTYYSYYPYNREDYKKKKLGKSDFPSCTFKLLKSAVCTSLKERTQKDFLYDVYDVLDCPDCRDIEDYTQPFTLDDIYVEDNHNLYGATNNYDGIYVIDDDVFVQTYDGFVKYDSIEDAILECYKYHAYKYHIVDFRLQTLEEHNSLYK